MMASHFFIITFTGCVLLIQLLGANRKCVFTSTRGTQWYDEGDSWGKPKVVPITLAVAQSWLFSEVD